MMGLLDVIVVIITLFLFVVVAYRFYQNTKQMRSSGKPVARDSAEDFMHDFVDQPELWVKMAKGEKPVSAEEDASMSLMVGTAFDGFNAQCTLYEKGELEDHDLEILRESILRIASMPGVAKYLEALKPQMSTCLRSIVDGAAQ